MTRTAILRISLLLLLVIILIALKQFTHLGDWITFKNVEQSIRNAGLAGVLIYLVVYSTGLMMQVPGMLFAIIPLLVYDYPQAVMIAYAGTVAAVTSNFYIARMIGGQTFPTFGNSFVKRMLQRLNDQPVLTIFYLRVILFISPPLNYALALTDVRPSQYILGSMAGLAVPIGVVSIIFFYWQDVVMGWLT